MKTVSLEDSVAMIPDGASLMIAGDIEVELAPQGALIERLRALPAGDGAWHRGGSGARGDRRRAARAGPAYADADRGND
ncbi:hypothetical protein ACFOHT_25020 [Massilia oculi]|uniref:Uncharacterized protein n=1 Tax=Massilia oculi TaxID=945844 RepID=A0A2S2DNC3_9BURK|nr:hypothetical protein [Massilia oculi]AWL06880.1 hypothetical protein DIR46_22190 [Massilia oculi]